MDEKTVKASDVTAYLGFLPYQTFNSWIKIGLFGEGLQFPGRGADRRFTFKDVCLARIINEILLIAPNFRIAKKASESFRKRFGSASHLSKMIISVFYSSSSTEDERTIEERYLITSVQQQCIVNVNWFKLGDDSYWPYDFKHGSAVMIVPVDKIMEDVKRCFPELVEK